VKGPSTRCRGLWALWRDADPLRPWAGPNTAGRGAVRGPAAARNAAAEELGSPVVLVDDAAEDVAPADLAVVRQLMAGHRGRELTTPVWTSLVVVADEVGEHRFQVTSSREELRPGWPLPSRGRRKSVSSEHGRYARFGDGDPEQVVVVRVVGGNRSSVDERDGYASRGSSSARRRMPPPLFALTAFTVVFEPSLGVAKRRLGRALGSLTVGGEGTQDLLCAAQAGGVPVGLVANTLLVGGGSTRSSRWSSPRSRYERVGGRGGEKGRPARVGARQSHCPTGPRTPLLSAGS
jgi:hypothetical protein